MKVTSPNSDQVNSGTYSYGPGRGCDLRCERCQYGGSVARSAGGKRFTKARRREQHRSAKTADGYQRFFDEAVAGVCQQGHVQGRGGCRRSEWSFPSNNDVCYPSFWAGALVLAFTRFGPQHHHRRRCAQELPLFSPTRQLLSHVTLSLPVPLHCIAITFSLPKRPNTFVHRHCDEIRALGPCIPR